MLSIFLDSWYYKEWTLVAYNFIYFNALSGQSAYFGTGSWFDYILKYPLILTFSMYGFIIFGIYKSLCKTGADNVFRKNSFHLLSAVYFTYTTVLSLVGHTDYRFTTPLYYIT